MAERKWGVWYKKAYEYESFEEAKRNYDMASWDVPAVLVHDDGAGWQSITGEFVEVHEIDSLLVGDSFVYEKPAFDWDLYVVRKYTTGWFTTWWVEEKYGKLDGTLDDMDRVRGCRMVDNKEARTLYNTFNGRI